MSDISGQNNQVW